MNSRHGDSFSLLYGQRVVRGLELDERTKTPWPQVHMGLQVESFGIARHLRSKPPKVWGLISHGIVVAPNLLGALEITLA
jgi:hypothetical protein